MNDIEAERLRRDLEGARKEVQWLRDRRRETLQVCPKCWDEKDKMNPKGFSSFEWTSTDAMSPGLGVWHLAAQDGHSSDNTRCLSWTKYHTVCRETFTTTIDSGD